MAIILAGDIGGTKTHLGLYSIEGDELVLRMDHSYATRDYAGLEPVVEDFAAGDTTIAAACFGVAGPVIDGVSQATNVPWQMREDALAKAIGGVPTRLINDLAATAYGVLHLKHGDVLELQRGEHRTAATIAVIAAGTGLGEAALIAAPGGWYALATEGGHTDFAPIGAEQAELLDFLRREFGHVSCERVLSGPGLHNVYRFVTSRSAEKEPGWLSERMASEDPSAVIGEAAIAGSDANCVRALEMFVAIYGAEAANLALKFLALGGVYVCGGIAPKILPAIRSARFMRAFLDKGRLSAALARIPVRVSLHPETGLIGAAHFAASMLTG